MQFGHQEILGDQTGPVRAAVEVVPVAGVIPVHPVGFRTVEDRFFANGVVVEQFLIEGPHGAEEDVGLAEIFPGAEFLGGLEFELQQATAQVDLEESWNAVGVMRGRVLRGSSSTDGRESFSFSAAMNEWQSPCSSTAPRTRSRSTRELSWIRLRS